jgi:predicted nucleic acid-binding protein
MTGLCFVDTNVLVYFRDASEPQKQRRARAWLERLWASRAGRLSYQVLSEFYVTVTQRLDPGLEPVAARTDVRNLMAWQPVSADRAVMERAWAVQDRYRLSWWDALIVSAAQKAGCEILLTEDLQDGQVLDGPRVVDPFRHTAQEVLAHAGDASERGP